MGLKYRILARMLEDITWSADWQGKSFFKFLFLYVEIYEKVRYS